MSPGIALCFLAALSFGLSACVSKIASRQNCQAPPLVASLFAWAALIMMGQTIASNGRFSLPGKAAGIALIFGVCAGIAIIAFQTSVSLGKVTVAWVVMNLSAGVPALVSILVYNERLTWLKCLSFVIAVASLACLFQGKRMEEQAAK